MQNEICSTAFRIKCIVVTKSNEKLKLSHQYYWHSATVWKFKKQYYSYNMIAEALNTLEMEEVGTIFSHSQSQEVEKTT